MRQTFTKAERLTSRKIIDRLFEKGSTDVRTFYLFPFRILYLYSSGQPIEDVTTPVESSLSQSPLPAILITVSRRNFKKAVDRNLIRRRIREAYRKNKAILVESKSPDKQLPAYITFLYTAREKNSFEEIEKSVKLALKRVGRGQ